MGLQKPSKQALHCPAGKATLFSNVKSNLSFLTFFNRNIIPDITIMSREALAVEPLTTVIAGQGLDMVSNVFFTVRAIYKPPGWHGPRSEGGSGVGVQADHGLVSWARAWQIILAAWWKLICWDY